MLHSVRGTLKCLTALRDGAKCLLPVCGRVAGCACMHTKQCWTRTPCLQISDRLLMGISLLFCGVGCVTMISYTGGPLSMAEYIISFTLILAFTNILEGVSMSVLSKVIPQQLSKGTFNAGVLSNVHASGFEDPEASAVTVALRSCCLRCNGRCRPAPLQQALRLVQVQPHT